MRDIKLSGKKPEQQTELSRITFLGHSSVLITTDGVNILTDPNFSRHILFLIRRRSRIPIRVGDLPHIDLVLISHAHFDHLDISTLRKLPRETPVVAPKGIGRILGLNGIKNVITRVPWESYNLGNINITAVPARHFAGRPPLFPNTGYQGYILQGISTVYFAGDSGLFDEMYEIGRKWAIDVALLPIGAYSPPPFRRHHMSPEDAIEAAGRLRARAIVPIHWGAFKLSLEPFDEPTRRLVEIARKTKSHLKINVLSPGQSISVRSDGSIGTAGAAST